MQLKGNHIRVIKGDTGYLIFRFFERCKPFALDGYTVKFIIKKEKDAPDSTAILAQDLTVEEAGGNTVSVALSAQFTDRTPDTFFYGVRLIKDGVVQTALEGNFTVEQGVFA
ncbi:MAG TPA: hypothetical protein IAB21_03375 [Candidatus Avelusimicrobium excrementipullorum]|nr:hypothetical protein [Candidatus Avelusimicrobium excrementipullorum]